jgi:hypothetical protein
MTETRVDGSCPNDYTLTRTWTATDSCGNSSSETQVIKVQDTKSPTFSKPPTNHSATADDHCQAKLPDFTAGVVASDSCSTVTLSQSPAAGTSMTVGHNPVRVTATDACGNATSVGVFFDVTDNTPPSITCPANITADFTIDTGAVVNYPAPTATDNCPGVVTTTCTSASGSVFPLGSTTVTCTATDASLNTASCSFTVTVVPPPSSANGSFVIGDLNAAVGNQVTFWGAQWWKLNSLSGGSAPSSFKGFANSTSTTPPTCGGSWSTDPGNSSGPPSSVPSYITVLVSSSITKSGSNIAGNTRQMVIVRTNPGYGPNPGHAGTGTVVAVICR